MTALHGFLGRPSDWSAIPCTRIARKPDWMPTLAGVDAGPGLISLAARVNQLGSDDGTLVGYSMGGRIAMHMLVGDQQQIWKRAIIVSASPGLSDGEDRADRMNNDLRWAERFQFEPWEATVAAWNSQGVFANDPAEPVARKVDFNRDHLARSLVLGSVATQADLRKQLTDLNIPILWLAGEKDPKYAGLAEECAALKTHFESKLIPGAGHRVPWTHTDEFCKAVGEFLSR